MKNTTWLENGTHHFNAQDFYKKSWETSTLEYLKYIIYLKLILVAPRNEQIVRFAISPACCWIRSVVSDHLKAVNLKFPNHQKWIDDVHTLDKNMVKPHQINAMPHQKPALWIQERAFYPVTLQEATPSGWPWNLHRKRWRVTLPRTLIASTCTFGTLQEGTIGNSCIYGSYGNSCFLCFNTSQISSSASVMAIASKQSKFAPQKHHPCPSLSTWSWCNKGVCVCVDLGSMVRVGMSHHLNAAPSVLDEFGSGKSPTSIQNGQGICVLLILHHVQFWFCHNFAFLQQIAYAKWRCISQSRHILRYTVYIE